MQKFFGDPTHRSTIDDADDDCVAPCLGKPLAHSMTNAAIGSASRVGNYIEWQEQKGIAQAIIGTRLGDNNLLEILGYVLIGKLSLDNGVGEDGICGRNTRTDGKRLEEVDVSIVRILVNLTTHL